ncbi:MAG: hypothetical protein QW666_03615, partial [Candidatus Woesearchaeota archaeon]
MNKKAVAWPVIIGGIAAIVIIATLIGPLKGVWHVVGERIFGTISPPSAEEFVPYVGPTAASIAENSFRAFICGSKIVYFNEVNFTTYCPDGMRVNIKGTNACSGVMYGNTCVECGNENKGANARLVCNVKHFELPEDAPYVLNQGFVVGNLGRITSWVSPAIAKSLFDYDNPVIPWLTGVGDPSYLMYYERFNEGEDVWWHVDAFSVNVMFIVTATVFNAIFGAGGASVVKAARAAALSEAAAMVAKKTMTKESFRELAKKSMILGVREVIERNIVVRGFRFFGRQLTKLFLRDTPEKATKAGMMRRVLVSMSEEAQAMLSPQGIDRIIDEGLLRKGFIAKNGALTISKDELKALIKKEAYDTTKLGITETEALIKDSSEKLLEQVSPLKGGRLWKNTLNFKNADEFYANFNRALSHSDEKIRTSLLKEAERGNFASALKQQDSQLYNRLTDGLRMKNAPPALKDDFINALATDAKKTIDDNVKLIEKKADDFAEKATMEIVEKYSGKITSEMIKEHNRVMAVVSYFEKYANADGTFNKMAFAKNLAEGDGKKMLDAFDKLPLEYQEKAIASAFETASAMGERDFQTIITNIGKAVEELEAKDKTLFSKLMDRLDSMIVHVEGYAKKVPYAGRGAVAIERATRWAAVKGGTVTYRSAKFVRDNRINLFILAYFIADWMDSRNEKFIDRGSYALVLNQPNMKLGNDIVEHLPENFSYITLLRDGDRAPIRFHMVSPCLTDLKIYGGTQTCVLNEDIYKYNLFDLEDTGK